MTLRELAYKEGVRALDEQQATLNSLHLRATALLASLLVAESFLAPRAFDGAGPLSDAEKILVVQAAALFVLAAGLIMAVLWPAKWKWTCSAAELVGPQWTAHGDDGAVEHLARYLNEHADVNGPRLKRRALFYQAAILAAAVSLGTWLALTIVTR